MGTPLLEARGSERGMGKGEGVVGKVWGGAADSQRKRLWLSYPRAQPGLPASMRGQSMEGRGPRWDHGHAHITTQKAHHNPAS